MIITDTLSTLRRHWAALALSIIVGILCIAPQLYFATQTPEFAGIHLMGSDAEDHYTARINQVYVGYPLLGNTFMPDKSTPFSLPGLGENIVARIGMILKLTAAQVNVFSKFVFPLLITLLVYAFGLKLFRSRGSALLSAGIITLGDGLISGTGAWIALLYGTSVTNSFLNFARPINPEISALLLFGGLYCIYVTFFTRTVSTRTATRWRNILMCALCTGAALYVSIFVFTFLVAVQTVSFVWLVCRRYFSHARSVVAIGVITAAIMIPYFLNYLRLTNSLEYTDLLMRSGVAMSHAPIIGFWIPILLIFVIFFMPWRHHRLKPFFLITLTSLLIILNQQIITGHIVQPGHYHWYITIPLIGIILGMYGGSIGNFLFESKKTRVAFYTLCLGVLIYNGITVQIHSYAGAHPGFVRVQKYAPLFTNLNTLPDRKFIWSNNEISNLLSIYTPHDNATTHQALNYLVPKKYFEDVLLLHYRLRGITPKNILATMTAERGDVSSAIYAMYWREQAGSFAAIPDADIEKLAKRYIEEYPKNIVGLFYALNITTIIWDKASEPTWHINTLKSMHKTYESGSIEVYELQQPAVVQWDLES